MLGVSVQLLVLAAGASLGISASLQDTKQAKIQRLLEVTPAMDIEQTRSLFEAGMERAAGTLSPRVKDRVWREFVSSFPQEEAISRIATLYDELFAESDVDDLLSFYETPVGRKLAESQADLATRSILIVEELSTRTAQQIASKLFYYLEGESFRAAGQLESAVQSIRKAVALDPNDADFREALGRALASLGRVDEARIELDEMARLRPGKSIDPDVLAFVGLWRFETNSVWIEIFEDGRAFQCRIAPDGTVLRSEGTLREGRIVWLDYWGTDTVTRTPTGLTVEGSARRNDFTISLSGMDGACARPGTDEQDSFPSRAR